MIVASFFQLHLQLQLYIARSYNYLLAICLNFYIEFFISFCNEIETVSQRFFPEKVGFFFCSLEKY